MIDQTLGQIEGTGSLLMVDSQNCLAHGRSFFHPACDKWLLLTPNVTCHFCITAILFQILLEQSPREIIWIEGNQQQTTTACSYSGTKLMSLRACLLFFCLPCTCAKQGKII